MLPIFFQLGWNLDGDWPIRRQNPYQPHQFVNVDNNNYTCCAKMAGKEETPKCRKKTVTRTNEMIEDLIDFIEIHPIVTFEAIYEPMLTSFWSLISFAVQLYIIMQYKGQHPPLLQKMTFCLLYLPPKLVCIHQNFLHRVYTNLNSSFLDPSFLEWRLGCKTCIVYTGRNTLSLNYINDQCNILLTKWRHLQITENWLEMWEGTNFIFSNKITIKKCKRFVYSAEFVTGTGLCLL